MGADGSIVVMPRWQWDQRTDRKPRELGFYEGVILGVDAVWSYYGEPDYIIAPALYPESDEEKELIAWFEGNAENHEVWT